MEHIRAGCSITYWFNTFNGANPPVLYNPSGSITITITDPTGVDVVANQAATNSTTGLYFYRWQSSASSALGDYVVSVTTVDTTWGTNPQMQHVAFVLTDQEGLVTTPGQVVDIGDADFLQGHTWDSPAPIGSSTPNTGAFTTLTATSGTFGTLTSTGTFTAPIQDKGGQVYNVEAYGLRGDNATDNSPLLTALLTAIGAGGGVILFPRQGGTYLFNSQVTMTDRLALRFTGTGPQRAGNETLGPRLVYTAATGSLLRFNGMSGGEIDHLRFEYSHASYNGRLIEYDAGSIGSIFNHVHDCGFQGTTASSKAAEALIALTSGYSWRIEQCLFTGAAVGIKSTAASVLLANDVTIEKCFFGTGGFSVMPILMGGQGWHILRNTFEPRVWTGVTSTSTNEALDTAAIGVNGGEICGNWMGDGGNSTWIKATGGPLTGVSITGNFFSSIGTATAINLGSSVGILIAGNRIECPNGIVCGSASTITVLANTYPGGGFYMSGQPLGHSFIDNLSSTIVGNIAPQSAPMLGLRGGFNGATPNAMEWGHTNGGGYGNAIGHEANTGNPYIAFNCEGDIANANKYRTRGQIGSVIRQVVGGNLQVGVMPSASAQNLDPTIVADFRTTGFNLASGLAYLINGVGVLSGTTLGNAVVNAAIRTNTPNANLVLSHNGVNAVTVVESGALVNSLYVSAGNTLINTTTTSGASYAAGALGITVSGSTSAGYLELITQQADADNNAVGRIGFADKNGTGDKLPALIRGALSGATANNRGGKMEFWTKINNGSVTIAMTLTNAQEIQYHKAIIAPGGGSNATMNTATGGSGPATAQFNGWWRVIDSTGAACFIPVWK